MTNLAVTAQWYATIFYFKSDTCQQMGLASLVALSATTYILHERLNSCEKCVSRKWPSGNNL